jgi:hypothetical protein
MEVEPFDEIQDMSVFGSITDSVIVIFGGNEPVEVRFELFLIHLLIGRADYNEADVFRTFISNLRNKLIWV